MTNEQEPLKLNNESSQYVWYEYVQKNGLPQAVVFDVTNVCDSPGCLHCYADAVKPGSDLGIFMDINIAREWSDILANDQKSRPQQIWISGGEPTLYPDLGSILGTLKEKQFYTVLVTNGERLANKEFSEQLTSRGNLDEIAVTVRGEGKLHDLFMLPANNPIWKSMPENLSYKEQMDFVKNKADSAEHFERTINGIVNLSKAPKLKIGINVDIQAAADMEKIVREIGKRGGRVDYVYLQVQQEAGRAKEMPEILPNLWRKPTVEMVGKYVEQSERLLKEKVVEKVVMIDPLPGKIVDALNLRSSSIYQPAAMPAISPRGELRSNVLHLPQFLK